MNPSYRTSRPCLFRCLGGVRPHHHDQPHKHLRTLRSTMMLLGFWPCDCQGSNMQMSLVSWHVLKVFLHVNCFFKSVMSAFLHIPPWLFFWKLRIRYPQSKWFPLTFTLHQATIFVLFRLLFRIAFWSALMDSKKKRIAKAPNFSCCSSHS